MALMKRSEEREYESIIIDNNEKKLIKLILEKGTDIIISNSGETLLTTAIRLNEPLMVDTILSFPNANVNVMRYGHQPSLYVACDESPPNIEIISTLLAHKADVNLSTKYGATPLMAASFIGNVLLINLLIEAGANIDAIDKNNQTAVIYAIQRPANNPEALNVLLYYGAKLSISWCPMYNPLVYAIHKNPKRLDELLPYYKKHDKILNDALMDVILTNDMDNYQKLIIHGAKVPNRDMSRLLSRAIPNEDLENLFYLLWRDFTNQEVSLNPKTIVKVYCKVFQERARVSFFKSSLKMIINTPVHNCNLTDERLVISTIFVPNPDSNYDWDLCKDILLEFCDYIHRLGVHFKNYDLIIFIQYFQGNCNFITELLAVLIKYNPDLVTIHDVMYLSRSNDLNLASYLLHNCSDVNLIYPRSIYEISNLNKFSEDMLKFFLERFTPTKSDTTCIRSFETFDQINIETKVPTLLEIARNAVRKTLKNTELKELIKNSNICSDFEDILYFKTKVNHI